jgi:Propeptide_C25.
MKKLYLFIMLSFAAFAINAQTIEHTYHFCAPIVETQNGYQQINFKDCMQAGQAGEPSLPWQSINLLLPMNHEASKIEIEFSNFVELEGAYNLYPYQNARPLSETENIPFAKDEELYRSSNVYPRNNKSGLNTYYLNGCSFAFSGFTPVRYIPSTGKISYAKTVKVKIYTENSCVDKQMMLNLTPDNQRRVKSLAQNPEFLDNYQSKSRIVSGYELLVVTPQEWVDGFDAYKEFYQARGLRTRVTSLEEIYASMQGVDDQEKIRNYIIQEYQNNGIIMVLLGGDSGLIPYRGFYCYVSEDYIDNNIPADMYYACLDGTWNDNGNELWGEIGEDDLLPEIGIGRMCFNNETQFDNLMHKTFTYQENPVLGEFNTVTLGAEHLGDGYYGSTDLELLIGERHNDNYTTIGIPEEYDFRRVYATSETPWNGLVFRQAINKGGSYTHHVGHANTDYVAGWYASSINDNSFPQMNGIDHNYSFFHSHGCICGDFTHGCILEKLTTISTGFVSTTGNSRYGWYIPWGDGPSRHLNRELVDAYYHERIPYIGLALTECKIQCAPKITMYGEDSPMRWNFYDINVLGDVAVCPWLDEPFTPDITYSNGLLVGTTSTEIHIAHDGLPLSNFRCGLYHEGTLLGFAMTDDEGNANLEFSPAIDMIGDMTLIITGPNAWPQQLNVKGFDEGEAFLLSKNMVFNDNGNSNGIAEFGEFFTTNIEFENIGTTNANNITATLSCESEHITITNATVDVGELQANESRLFENAFAFTINDIIPDFSKVYFTVECTDGTSQWNSQFPLRVMAPNLAFTSFTINDSQGNNDGIIDAGELITIEIEGINEGHATGANCVLNGTCDASEIYISESTHQIGQLNPEETFTVSFEFTSDENTTGGSIFDLNLSLTTGNYTTTETYVFAVGHATETFESGDFSFMEWHFGGEQPWTITDSLAYTGNYCAQSGDIDDNQISSLIISFDTYLDGEISFFYKTATEKRDYLIFYIDGKVMDFWGDNNDWTNASYAITPGSHVIEWRYDKSPNVTESPDHVWLDDISFPSASLITSIESKVESNICLYPNPNNGTFNIDLKDEKCDITIVNILGQVIFFKSDASGMNTVDLSTNDSGLYFVRLKSDSIDKSTKIIVK